MTQQSRPLWPALVQDVTRRIQAGATVRIVGDAAEIHLPGHSISLTDRRYYDAACAALEGAPADFSGADGEFRHPSQGGAM